MRPLAELQFIRDRVLAEIRANPPMGPLLGKKPIGRPRKPACPRGHVNPQRYKGGHCVLCDRDRQRAR